MTKMLTAILTLVLLSANAFADGLFQKHFNIDENISAKERVLETFTAALADKKTNKVQEAFEQLKKDLEGTGAINDITQDDIFLTHSGKGSASTYGNSFLVGVPVSMQGTGLIEEYDLYFIVRYNVDMAQDSETVTIESLADIQAK